MSGDQPSGPAIPRTLTALAALVCLLALAACAGPAAPSNPGVCWRRVAAASGPPKFTVVANDITSLENCAVLLEALRLQGQSNTNGAFQGYYLTVDDDRMSSSTSPRTFGYPILQPPQREEIDRDLRRLIKERGGKMPDPGDVSVERQ